MKNFLSELDLQNTPTMFSNENVVAWMRPELVIVEHAWHPREKFNTHFVSFSEHLANPDLSHMESLMSDGKQCFEDRKIRLLDVWKNKSFLINIATGPYGLSD